MSSLQSPVKTIKDALYAYWIDDGTPLDRDNIIWRIGPPDDLTARFHEGNMSFEFTGMVGLREKRTLTRGHVAKMVLADFWLKMATDDDPETCDGYIQTIIDKVADVIKTYQLALTDLNFVKVGPDRNLDEPENMILRRQFEIECRYQE